MSYLSDWRALFRYWRKDLLAGITVGIVALPLALGFAITTGASASAGLSTAIVAGFIAALFGGSNFQVSGPTGAMTVVLVPIVAKYGIQSLVLLGIAAGSIIILMSLFRLGRWIDAVPWSVMEGFTLGIALIIALQQLPLVLEVPKAPGTHTISVAIGTIHSALNAPLHWSSISIALLTVAIKRLWPWLKRKAGISIHIPGSIVAIVLVTLLSQLLSININRIGELPRALSLTHDFSMVDISLAHFAYAAVVIAMLGAIESLLSARVADGMAHKVIDHEQGKHDPNKELFGQGLATIASACVGGLPATGAIARTTVNVHAGARSRLSAIIHSLFLLVVVFLLAPVVSIIPTAALAGVLLGTSLRIATPKSIKEALRTTFEIRVVYLCTAISVVAIDLIWGTLIGLALHLIIQRQKKKI
jgi:sulfate permease, SulP family